MAVTFHTSAAVANWGADVATQTTAAATTSANDLIVVALAAEQNSGTTTFGNPVTTGITYGSPKVSNGAASRGQAIIWAAVDTTGASRTAAVTASVADWFGLAEVFFTGASGTGNTGGGNFLGTTSQAVSITTTAANSGILWVMGDWSAVNYPSRTYTTINGFTPAAGGTGEVAYANVSTQYTAWIAYWPNCGAIGTYSAGAATTITGSHSMSAIEILASGSGPPKLAAATIKVPKLIAPNDRAARW